MNKLLRISSMFLCILVLSCQANSVQKVSEKINEIDSTTVENADKVSKVLRYSEEGLRRVYLENKNDLIFEVETYDTTWFKDFYSVDIVYSIRNNTNSVLYFIEQSCNNLDYYLVFRRTDSARISPFINCNASWGVVSKIQPQKSVHYVTSIISIRGQDIDEIGLDFRVVDRYISFDSIKKNQELIENAYRSQVNWNEIIWTELKPADDIDFIQECQPKRLKEEGLRPSNH